MGMSSFFGLSVSSGVGQGPSVQLDVVSLWGSTVFNFSNTESRNPRVSYLVLTSHQASYEFAVSNSRQKNLYILKRSLNEKKSFDLKDLNISHIKDIY